MPRLQLSVADYVDRHADGEGSPVWTGATLTSRDFVLPLAGFLLFARLEDPAPGPWLWLERSYLDLNRRPHLGDPHGS